MDKNNKIETSSSSSSDSDENPEDEDINKIVNLGKRKARAFRNIYLKEKRRMLS